MCLYFNRLVLACVCTRNVRIIGHSIEPVKWQSFFCYVIGRFYRAKRRLIFADIIIDILNYKGCEYVQQEKNVEKAAH